MSKTYLVTGGAGFIGANFVKYMLKQHANIKIIVLDALTYAGNLFTIEDELKDSRVSFVKGDICNKELVDHIFGNNDIDYVINFAAESHVDRSIENPKLFLETNILGTQNLMDCAKNSWTIGKDEHGYPIYESDKRFHQIGTDEVYGALSREYPDGVELELAEDIKQVLQGRTQNPKTFGKAFFTESTNLDPKSPYSSSKASADMLVMAYNETYKFPVTISRCSNNYGPFHYPEKLIPLIIQNVLAGKQLPVYGDGKQVRDWLYVDDHCKGIDIIVSNGKNGEIYNIGGFNEEQNINIVKLIIAKVKKLISNDGSSIKNEYKSIVSCNLEDISENLISYVQDRLGHDARYAIDPTKTVKELNFYPETPFTDGIEKTIKWYLDNQTWVNKIEQD